MDINAQVVFINRPTKLSVNGVDQSEWIPIMRAALNFQMDLTTTMIGNMIEDGDGLDEREVAIRKRRAQLLLLELIDGVEHTVAVTDDVNPRVVIAGEVLPPDLRHVLVQALMSHKAHNVRGFNVLDKMQEFINSLLPVTIPT
jgi:hypothetical protein